MHRFHEITLLTLALLVSIEASQAAESSRPASPPNTNSIRGPLLEEDKIIAAIGAYQKTMVRVTESPYQVTWPGKAASTLCGPPPGIPHSPHGNHWIHVFVTSAATNAMLSGQGRYPQGSIILKQKLLDAGGARTELFTGMRKREPGYNPELGDWEFFTLDSTARMVTARGKIESCMDCHTTYQATDFVTRRYLTSKADDGGW
jgi:hypothetical protein